MFSMCPKCRHAVPAATPPAEICPACGLVFRKFVQAVAAQPRAPAIDEPQPELDEEEEGGWFRRWFLFVPDEVESWRVYTGASLLALSMLFGWRYARMDIPDAEMMGTFLHTAMVPFH